MWDDLFGVFGHPALIDISFFDSRWFEGPSWFKLCALGVLGDLPDTPEVFVLRGLSATYSYAVFSFSFFLFFFFSIFLLFLVFFFFFFLVFFFFFLFFFFFFFPFFLLFFFLFSFNFSFFFLRSERLPYRWWYSLLPTPLLLLSYSPLLDLASRRLLGWCHVRPVPWEPEVLKYWILGPVWPKLLFPPIVSCDEKNGLFECFKCGREILLYDYECCV